MGTLFAKGKIQPIQSLPSSKHCRTLTTQDTAMAVQSIKLRNKQRKRNLLGLKSKCYKYGELSDIELGLVVYCRKEERFYTYISTERVLP